MKESKYTELPGTRTAPVRYEEEPPRLRVAVKTPTNRPGPSGHMLYSVSPIYQKPK